MVTESPDPEICFFYKGLLYHFCSALTGYKMISDETEEKYSNK